MALRRKGFPTKYELYCIVQDSSDGSGYRAMDNNLEEIFSFPTCLAFAMVSQNDMNIIVFKIKTLYTWQILYFLLPAPNTSLKAEPGTNLDRKSIDTNGQSGTEKKDSSFEVGFGLVWLGRSKKQEAALCQDYSRVGKNSLRTAACSILHTLCPSLLSAVEILT
jgi:hypothetical protein